MCPPANENYADCSAGSPEWYANRIATGEGNETLNQIGGALSTLARSAAEHTSGSVTLGFETVETDAEGMVHGVENGQSSVQQTVGLPSAGASVGFTVGKQGTSSVSIGWSQHLGFTIHLNGNQVSGVGANLGVSTPNPVSGTDNTVVSQPIPRCLLSCR